MACGFKSRRAHLYLGVAKLVSHLFWEQGTASSNLVAQTSPKGHVEFFIHIIPSSLETEQVGLEDEYMVPNLTESVSVDANGVLHITMTNVDLEKAYPVEAVLLGKKADEIKAEIVTGHMQDKNTFEEPETVGVQGFDGVQATKEGISFTIPACSVLHIAVK